MRNAAQWMLMSVFLAPGAMAGSWSSEQIGGMSVQLYTPSSAPQLDGRRALMVNLHGCAQTASDLKVGGNWQAVADQYGMVVALPDAPNGGVIAGCWDYYGTNHTRSNRHNDNILALVDALEARADLNVDPRQIYLSGLSSGGGQSMVMACLAPEVFAGVGIDAGPTIGTSSAQIGSVATTQSAAVTLCQNLAAGRVGDLPTQAVSVVYGTSDFVVSQDYGRLNARVFAQIQGATQKSGTVSISGGGTETRWERGGIKAVQLISVTNLGHAWPAGPGSSGGAFIDHTKINYPAVLTRFLFCANARVPGDRGNCDDAATSPGTPGPGNPPALYCGADSNTNHALAGRAIQFGTGPFASYGAKGSFQWLGYAGVQTTLRETSPAFFVIAISCN